MSPRKKSLTAVPKIECIGVRRDCSCHKCWLEKKRYRVAYNRGYRATTDAEPVRQHLQCLADLGIGRRTISDAVGLPTSTLGRISMGEVASVKLETAEKILAFTTKAAARVPNSSLVDATASIKRMQALRAMGYSTEWIAERCGGGPALEIRGSKVTRVRANAILAACLEAGETPGPCERAAKYARKQGWRRPIEYDEDLFYDIEWDGSEPDAAVECRGIQLTSEYDHLKSCGMSEDDGAAKLRISVAYLRSLLSKRARGIYPFGAAEDTDDDRMVG